MRNDINNKDNLSLAKADYGYRRCMECVSEKGKFTGTKLGEFYLKQDSKKADAINNRAIENSGKSKILKNRTKTIDTLYKIIYNEDVLKSRWRS